MRNPVAAAAIERGTRVNADEATTMVTEKASVRGRLWVVCCVQHKTPLWMAFADPERGRNPVEKQGVT